MARGFRLEGHEIVTDPASADLRVVNTCTVTAAAGRDSRSAARRLHAGQRVVATGCHADRHPEEFKDADLVVPNADKENLAARALERLGLDGLALGMDRRARDHGRIYPLALDTTRAFVKIQDGCDLRCSFCLTTLARGMSRSREAGEIVEEITRLVDGGCQEAVLTGVHAGSYGLDLDRDLGWLVDLILTRTALPRLRLSSLEPWNFKSDWTALWSAHPGRLCRHLHMSLQSGSRTVLRRMRRHYDPETFAEKVAAARAVPGMAITTDLIVGFPGETPEEHGESLAFARTMAFAGAHLFRYSARPGTDAALMPNQIGGEVKRLRHAEMAAMLETTAQAFRQSLAGTVARVLWEKPDEQGIGRGYTDTYAEVRLTGGAVERNTLVDCHLALEGTELVATPVKARP